MTGPDRGCIKCSCNLEESEPHMILIGSMCER